MKKNLITGLSVLAVAGIAYYFWRRNQLVLAKEKADSNKSVDDNTVLETTKVAETNTSNTTVSTNPNLPVGSNTEKKASNFRKIWEGRGGKAKYLELNRDKIAEKLAQAQSSNTTVSTNPNLPVGSNTEKKARNFRKIWEGRGGKAKYLELNRDKIAEKLAQAQSQFYGQESEEEPIISNINTYPYGRYNSVNIMVDEANY
jgi:sarcosine oxidase delta subunit